MLKIFIVTDEYIEHCRKFDSKVQNNHKPGEKFIKKYLGIVFELNEIKYYVPFSSYKPDKHDKMKDNVDFIRIEDNDKKYAVLNLNNMIPVPDNAIIEFDINSLNNGSEEERKYRDLLWDEWEICKSKQEKIIRNANTLYKMVLSGSPVNVVNRCCNFKLLETVYEQYEQAAATKE